MGMQEFKEDLENEIEKTSKEVSNGGTKLKKSMQFDKI